MARFAAFDTVRSIAMFTSVPSLASVWPGTVQDVLPWVTLALLGGFHGVNPAMGWLFAVALGLQERSRRAVLAAFGPIALGHAMSVALVVSLVAFARIWIGPDVLRLVGAGVLIAF